MPRSLSGKCFQVLFTVLSPLHTVACASELALNHLHRSEARRRYWSKSDNFEADICEDLNSVTPPKEPVVGYVCPLFARKFPVSASSKALEQLSSCENGLEILNIGCPGNFQRQPLQ